MTEQFFIGGERMKVKAIYRELKANPFSSNPKTPVIRAEFTDRTSMEEIEQKAKEATPRGCEFVKVEIESDGD